MASFENRLAEGQVDTSASAIYTAPQRTSRDGARTTDVDSLIFFNENAATQTIIVYHLQGGGSNRKIARFVLAQNERAVMEQGDLPRIKLGDQILAETTTASAVNYYVSGITAT